MRLNPRLDLRQTQGLVMTPQLQQAIKLLQLSNLELSDFVEEEIERNPLLERSDGEAPTADGAGEPAADYSASTESDDWSVAPSGPTDAVAAAGSEVGSFATVGSTSMRSHDSDFDPVQIIESARSLRDHLLEQLTLDIADPVQKLIGVQLIGMVDEAGYLPADLSPAATALGCSLERVEATLLLLQRFDPAGIFASNLRECLALQLVERDRLDPAMQTLLDHLDLLAIGELQKLSRLCDVDDEDIADMIAEIKALDPKPGLRFEQNIVQTLVPDIFVRPDASRNWRIELNSDTLPRVLVNNSYHAEIQAVARSKPDRDYLTGQLNSANWLLRALDQRARTILKVAGEIVRQQSAFFEHGIEHLRPLTLRDIAGEVELHESTVSRVTTNKYMATPRGTFELKFFFTSSISATAGGESHSSASVRHRIKALVEAESVRSVLSDDKITERLQHEGIDIARRTVAKYREAMRIPSSVERRRRLKAQSFAL